jgi:7-carboxy-7-deazaguanine synthase
MIKTEITYPIMETFYTLQGEGRFSGHPAYFIRLGGCDVGCVWCDVKDSWDASKHPQVSIDTIVQKVLKSGSGLSVITGGEPLMYDLAPLTSALKKAGIRTHVETSGAYPYSGDWDWFCLSPKKFKAALPECFEKADELKVIIFNASDYKFAEENAQLVNKDCELYLQVEWDKREKLLGDLIEYVKENPKWKLSTQVHKYIDIP